LIQEAVVFMKTKQNKILEAQRKARHLALGSRNSQRLSRHQKRVRLLAGAATLVAMLATFYFFWKMRRPTF